jgi:hypothetical protein
LTFNGLHGVISQKTELFITTAVRTSNPTNRMKFKIKIIFTLLERFANVHNHVPILTFMEKIESVGQTTKLRGLVRQRSIPTERPPLVGEVSANFSG